jgi:NADH-quinone oxidoreductase subunit G
LPAATLGHGALVSSIADFYLTNPIARASRVMGECSALAKGRMTAQAAE